MNNSSRFNSGILAAVLTMSSVACSTANCSARKSSSSAPPSSQPSGLKPTAVISVDEPDVYKTNAGLKNYFSNPTLTLTQGYAPFPVFFEGWQSSPREQLVRYEWDFGTGTESDEMGRTFEGFNAAHVFETAGTYTVSLRVLNVSGAWSDTATTTITVLSRDSGTTYYVDSSIGNDSNDGKSATAADGHGPWKTANKAFSALKKVNGAALLNPGDRVLFHRGQTIPLTGTIQNVHTGTNELIQIGHGGACQGVQYGAYGDASLAKPLIQWQGDSAPVSGASVPPSSGVFYTGYGLTHLVISDLAFNMWNSGKNSQLGGFLDGPSGFKNILFLRDDFSDSYDNIWGTEGLDPKPSGLFMVSCTVNNHQTAQWSYTHFYGSPSRLAILNSKFDESGNHIGYLKGVDKAVISKSVFSRPAFGRAALRITGGTTKDVGIGNNIEISDNQFFGWTDPMTGGSGRSGGAHNGGGKRMNYLLVELNPNGGGEELLEEVAFERNVVTNYEVGLAINNMWDGIVRNNLFVTPNAGTALCLNFGDAAALQFRPLKNVLVHGNTFQSGTHYFSPPWSDTGPIVSVHPYAGSATYGSADTNVQLKDNIFSTYPGGVTPTALELTGSMGGFTSDNNLFNMPNVAGGAFFKLAGTAQTLAAWQAATGYDSNSIAGDPGFAGGILSEIDSMVPGTPADQAACVAEASRYVTVFQLAAGSLAVDAGADLARSLSYDFLRSPRPVDGNGDGTAQTDIGAFEFQGAK